MLFNFAFHPKGDRVGHVADLSRERWLLLNLIQMRQRNSEIKATMNFFKKCMQFICTNISRSTLKRYDQRRIIDREGKKGNREKETDGWTKGSNFSANFSFDYSAGSLSNTMIVFGKSGIQINSLDSSVIIRLRS